MKVDMSEKGGALPDSVVSRNSEVQTSNALAEGLCRGRGTQAGPA